MVGVVMFAAACSSASPDSSEAECGGDDYPCSFADASVDVISRTLDLGRAAAAVTAAGGTMADVAESLEAEGDMAELVHDENALRFRLEGGVEHWIFDKSSDGTRSGVGGGPAPMAAMGHFPMRGNVVAENTDAKSAVVLSPSLWAFGKSDEGSSVAKTLAGTPGYEGSVTYLFNETRTATTIGFAQYENLNDFDVIHIATHGATVCEDGKCWGSLEAFSLDSILPSLEGDTLAEKLHTISGQGLALGHDKDGEPDSILLRAKYFEDHYPDGITDAVIFLSACETLSPAASDLVKAIQGAGSVVVGWDKPVNIGAAGTAARDVHKYLAERGYVVEDAIDEIGVLATPPDGSTLSSTPRGGGFDLRIREVVDLLDPESLELLTAGADVEIDGVAGDGVADSVPYAVRIDGIKVDDMSNTRVKITIDGSEFTTTVSSGERNEIDQWLLTGQIDLGYDVTEDKVVDIGVVVELPEGGESDEKSTIRIRGDAGGSWNLQVSYTVTSFHEGEASHKESGSANLALEEDEFQPTDDKTRLRVVGGTATADYNYETPLCIQTGPAVTWDVTEDQAAGAGITIDHTTDPPTLAASISIQGPLFEGTIACRAGTGSDAPPGYGEPEPTSFTTNPLFLTILREDAQTFDPDGTRASGTVISGSGGEFGSITEMTYVLTRQA